MLCNNKKNIDWTNLFLVYFRGNLGQHKIEFQFKKHKFYCRNLLIFIFFFRSLCIFHLQSNCLFILFLFSILCLNEIYVFPIIKMKLCPFNNNLTRKLIWIFLFLPLILLLFISLFLWFFIFVLWSNFEILFFLMIEHAKEEKFNWKFQFSQLNCVTFVVSIKYLLGDEICRIYGVIKS